MRSVPAHGGLRLLDGVVAVPALVSHVRPAVVLQERETRTILEAAGRQHVTEGGTLCANAAGVQVWSGPWDGPDGTPGDARQLGSVDWSYDSPARQQATIYRSVVTSTGVEAGETPTSIVARVLACAAISFDGDRVTPPRPLARDPFRHGRPVPDGS